MSSDRDGDREPLAAGEKAPDSGLPITAIAAKGPGSSAEDRSVAQHVAELVAAGKPGQAAAVCAARGDHLRASELLEEACDFRAAARQALLARDWPRALRLAALGGDEPTSERAIEALCAGADRALALRAAGDLDARGQHRHAADVYARLGSHVEAARAFVSAGIPVRAAESFERAGRPADGARALEAALRTRPGDAASRLALGRLLASHGRSEAAVKTLQLLAAEAPERALSLPLLARCLTELGLEDAARTVKDEMARLGISADEPAPRPIGKTEPEAALLFGRYRVVREVAATPHARVVEATDGITAERVAVKILAGSTEGAGRDALQRFEREARALAQLRHPNAVPLRGYLPEGPAMVLAWMPGGSLADLMRREPVAPARATEIACSVLDALGEAHRLGILHRDVKPANVLFDEIGTARLSDFGAAHLGDLSTTATAGAIGTFAYMSPEQRLGRPASMASDIYAVGAMLVELLTGAPAQPTRAGQLDPAPSSCHPDLGAAHDAVVARMLEEDQALRPADAFEARRMLSALRWSERLPDRRVEVRRGRTTDRPPASGEVRLAAAREPGDGRDAERRRHDSWMGRDVLVFDTAPENLERARAFARAGHASLPAVLRVDVAAAEIWIAAPLGRALADEARPLSPGQLAQLSEGVAALHEVGGAHGAVDGEHLYWHDGEVTLAFPRSAASAEDAERDRDALRRLSAP